MIRPHGEIQTRWSDASCAGLQLDERESTSEEKFEYFFGLGELEWIIACPAIKLWTPIRLAKDCFALLSAFAHRLRVSSSC